MATTVQLMLESEMTASFVELSLSARGYAVRRPADAWTEQSRRHPPDIAVFDLLASNPRRLHEISVLRGLLGSPVSLCITAMRDHETLAAAIRLGIEEFLFEPFGFPELEQRLDLLLCRRLIVNGSQSYPVVERRRNTLPSKPGNGAASGAEIPSFQLNASLKRVLVEGEEVRLSPREYQLVHLLAQEPGRIFSVQEIIQAVWPPHSKASTADVHQYMYMVRRKIEKHPDDPRWIKNIKGFGYMLSAAGPAG